jgi:hypothetical protein
MTRICIGIATILFSVMTACAIERGSPVDPAATSETSSEVREPSIEGVCLPFYSGAGNYYQCASTEVWYRNGGTCASECPEGACSWDFICGPGGHCDCEGT